jgi:ankyrin repeat protein
MSLLKKLAADYGRELPVDGKDGLGNTALHYACFGQHQGMKKKKKVRKKKKSKRTERSI